jgi:hypothetical protein
MKPKSTRQSEFSKEEGGGERGGGDESEGGEEKLKSQTG